MAAWSLSARRAWIEMPKIGLMLVVSLSLSARRAWIEICCYLCRSWSHGDVALRKESVDRNFDTVQIIVVVMVALRKESVDRNYYSDKDADWVRVVALRKESVDRND